MADIIRAIDIIFGAVDNTADGLTSVDNNFRNILDHAANLSAPLSRAADFALKANTAVLALGATLLTISVNEASKFGEKIEEIGSLVNNTADQNQKLSDSVLEFSKNVNGVGSTSGIDLINAALYNTVSNVGSTAKAFDILAVAEKGSQVGATDLNTAATLLTGTMNAYGLVTNDTATNTDNADRVMAAMFATVQSGKTTMLELEGSLGRVSSTAAAAKVPVETVGAAIAALTGAGVSTDESMTLLNSLLKELLGPSADLQKALGGLSITTDGLPKVLKALEIATGGSAEKFFALFTNSEAAKGAMILANDSAGKFDSTLTAMQGSVKAFNDNYAVMVGGVADSSTKLSNEMIALQIKIGQPLQDTWASVLDGMAKIGSGIETSIDAGTFEPVFNAFKGFETEVADVLARIGKNLPEALGQVDFAGLIAALKDLGLEFGDMFSGVDLTTPRGLADAIQFAVDSFESLTRVVSGVIDVWGPVVQGFVYGINTFNDLSDSSKKTAGEMSGLAQVFQTLQGSMQAGGNALSDVFGLFKSTFGILYETVSTATFVIVGLSTGTLGLSLALKAVCLLLPEFASGFKPIAEIVEIAVAAFTAYKVVTGAAALATTLYTEALVALNSPIGIIVASLASITWGVKQNVDSWQEYRDKHAMVVEASANLIDSQAKIKAKLEEISASTGVTVTTMDELNRAMDNNLIVMDKATGAYHAAGTSVQEYDNKVTSASTENIGWAESVDKVAKSLGLINGQLDESNKKTQDATDLQRGFRMEIVDGVKTYTQYGDALTAAHHATGNLKNSTEEATKAATKGTEEWKRVQEVILDGQKRTDDFSIKLGELANKRYEIDVKANVDLKTAEIVAETQRISAAFQATIEVIGALTKGTTDLWSTFSGARDWDKSTIKKAAERMEDRLDEELSIKREMTDAIIQKMQAESFRLESGEPLISIDARELAPELELVFDKILKYTQVKATQQGLSLLVGLA